MWVNRGCIDKGVTVCARRVVICVRDHDDALATVGAVFTTSVAFLRIRKTVRERVTSKCGRCLKGNLMSIVAC